MVWINSLSRWKLINLGNVPAEKQQALQQLTAVLNMQ
jgi:hypothetical protein